MKFKKIMFISPVNKGEEFSFEDLFSTKENEKYFDNTINDLVEEKRKSLKAELAEDIKKELEVKFNLDLMKKKLELKELSLSEKKDLNVKIKSLEKTNKTFSEQKEKEIKRISDLYKEQITSIKEQVTTTIKSLNEQFTMRQEILEKEFRERSEGLALKEKQANVIGDDAENTIRERISSLFISDVIEKPVAQTGGADIEHDVFDGKTKLGSIYYEIKNKNTWSSKDLENFAAKTRKRKDDFNVYICKTILKDNSRHQHIIKIDQELFYDERNNIYISTMESYIYVVYVLRSLLLKHKSDLNIQKNEVSIKDKVFEFITSQEFGNYFQRIQTANSVVNQHFTNIQKEAGQGKAQNDLVKIEADNLLETVNQRIKEV